MMLYHSKKKFIIYTLYFLLIGLYSNSFAQTTGQTFWWNDAVFYEVFVRSFKDSDGDGNGDLKGLIEKLDYLNDGDSSTHTDLGITAIWLMPIHQSPSYHGYDVIDYRTVEQDYGTNQDFKDFIAAAHSRGIKVIIDYVMNHTSSQHIWFTESTNSLNNKRDWYVWQNPKPVMTGPWGQNVWHTRNGSNYYGIFWSEMPDLNYNTPEVKTEMFDIARFWLEDMEVDGFRLDAIKYIFENGGTLEDTPETINFWNDFKLHYKSINSNALTVGEAWTATNKIQLYMADTSLDYCFEFDLASAIINATNSGSTVSLRSKIDEVIATYPFLQYGTFLTNHDMNRVMNTLGNSTVKAKLAASILLTLPGVPYIYYGEEIGMTGAKPDENIRKPLQWNSSANAGFTTGVPWRPVNADYLVKNIESQKNDATSLWNSYRDLIALRNNQAALRKGNYKNITASINSVFSFLRQYTTENIIVISNTSSVALSNVQFNYSQGEITPGDYILVELQSGSQLPITIDVNGNFSNLTISQLPAYTTYIYKLFDPLNISTDVTFEVDMNVMITNGYFNPTLETVDVVANFNNFGASSITTLSDANADGIYEVMIPDLNIGSKVNYKYRINGVNDGREEFSNSSYLREYIVLEGENTIKDQYQKNNITSSVKSFKYNVSVYPIPAGKEIFIQTSDGISGSIEYRISDMLGEEKLSSSFILDNQISQQGISVSELQSGVYLLTLTYEGVSEVFKIVVQR